MTKQQTLVQATEEFLTDASAWLTAADAPAVASLRMMAKQLDVEYLAALSNSYGLTYRSLLKRQPVAVVEEVDELDNLIPDAG
jgi:hypothetical protein